MSTNTQTHTRTMLNSRSRAARTEVKFGLPELSSSRACEASRERWKLDLNNLLRHAKKRFADIAWAVDAGRSDEIWAHKAIIYARASGQFQLKYLSAPAPPPHSRLPNIPSGSSTSFVPCTNSFRLATPRSSFPPDRAPPSPATVSIGGTLAGSVRQISLLNGTDPTLFQSILEALYTANGLAEVFAFLFDDHAAGDGPEARTLKLRTDLLYMWRSKLYADCQIVLVNQQNLDTQPEATSCEEEAVFSAHRSILCSRSPYFASLLLDPYADASNRVFTLASPPFTPASLHFSLGYLYCGTLEFSNRNFDLATATQIWRSAQYLGLDLLREEVEAKISDMCHNFRDLCKSCVSRIGRVYAFSLALDVNSQRLQKAAEPFVVEHFGSIWGRAIGELHYEAQTHLVDLVCLSIDPNTAISAIRGSKRLKERLANERSAWSDHLLSMLEPIDEQIGVVLQTKFPAVVTSKGFLDLLVGVGFSNDILEKALVILIEKLTEETAAETYQVLVGQVLLREDGLPMDARVIVEDAKVGVLKYLKSHWTSVRSLNGFDPLENWALKEISDEIGVPVDDLLSAVDDPFRTKTGLRLTSTPTRSSAKEEVRSISAASLRASVLSRSASRQQQHPAGTSQNKLLIKSTSSTATASSIRSHLASAREKFESTSLASNDPRPRRDITFPKLAAAKPAPRRPSASETVVRGAAPEGRATSEMTASPQLPVSSSAKSEPDPVSSTSSDKGRPNRKTSAPSGPRPPLLSAPKVQPRKIKTPRPPSPVPSVNSSTSKMSGKRTTPNASRIRPSSDVPRKPPRVRAVTGTSTTSERSVATTVSSGARKATVPKRPPCVRKTPSNLSMRSDASNVTIGARTRPMHCLKSTGIPGAAGSSSNVARKKVAVTVALSTPKKPVRLRTTSATARTDAGASVAPSTPSKSLTRPNSVTSVRTNTPASAASKAHVSRVLGSSTSSSSGLPKNRPNGKLAVNEPSLPNATSPASRTRKSTGRTSAGPPGEIAPSPRTRKISTQVSSPVTPRLARARKSPLTNSPPCDAEVISNRPTRQEPDHLSTHHYKQSNVSSSTIRSPPVDNPDNLMTPSNPAIVRTSSSRSVVSPPDGLPLKPPGTTLLIGIPCVVATTVRLDDGITQPTKFRAIVKYLGETLFAPGQWVGVEVAEKDDLPKKDWHDGTVHGVKYFELGQESKESKLRLFRNLSATPSGERSPSSHGHCLNGGSSEGGSVNSLRPSYLSKASGSYRSQLSEQEERVTKGLFVRPQEVIFVF